MKKIQLFFLIFLFAVSCVDPQLKKEQLAVKTILHANGLKDITITSVTWKSKNPKEGFESLTIENSGLTVIPPDIGMLIHLKHLNLVTAHVPVGNKTS
jgi:hypothetical protein